MKKIKKLLGILLISIFIGMSSASAATGTVVINGNSSVDLNNNISLTIGITNLSDSITGVGAVGGNIEFDSAYLQYIDCTPVTLGTDYTEGSKTISGLALNAKQAPKGASVNFITMNFKAIKEGKTVVRLKNMEISLYGQTSAVTTSDPSKEITISVPAPKNNDANLKSLGVTGHTLTPSFSPNTINYSVTVPAGTASVVVTGATNDSKARATGLGNYTLRSDTLSIPVKVTAEDGTTIKTYTIEVTREAAAKSNDANLKGLSVTGYTISPSFNKDTTSYNLTVPNGTSSLNVSALKNDEKAKVEITGADNLKVGSNSVKIKVTAEDGTTTKTYTINVTREDVPVVPKSNDANLKDLAVSGYDMTPKFNKDTLSYNLTVPNGSDKIIINASKSDDKARIDISGADNLKVGSNKVTVTVTAEDGTQKVYTINVTREEKLEVKPELDGNANLKSLKALNQKISPDFNKDITAYTIQVANNVNSINIEALADSDKAKVSISGNTNLKVGVNSIIVKVTAENGTTKTYTINVIKAEVQKPVVTPGKSSDNLLKSLDIKSPHTMDKTFNPNETSYSITVPYEVENLDLSYVTNNKNAKVTVKGNEDFKVDGINTVVLTVTAEDGSVNYYVLNVTRKSETSGTDLEKLVVDGKDIYEEGKTKYKVTTDKEKLDIEAILKDKDSKVEIMGNGDFKEGTNTVLVKVTDKDGMIKYYEIEVEKTVPNKKSSFFDSPIVKWGLGIGAGALVLFGAYSLFKGKGGNSKGLVINNNTKNPTNPTTPIIEFKPEFNFGSKNTSDDDVVHGNMNQNSEIEYKGEKNKKLIDADVEDATIAYVDDHNDETITKDEIVDAIHEAVRTKDTHRLKELLDQNELNHQRKELRRKEKLRRNDEDDDFWN